MKYMKYFFDGFFNSNRSEVKQVVPSPENPSLQATGLLEEAKQPLLTSIVIQESFGNSIKNEIRERKGFMNSITSDLKRIEKTYARKKGLYLIATLVCTGGMAGFIYLANKFRVRVSASPHLLDDWYHSPINSTDSNMTCAELFPSPPAGCDKNSHSPLGIDTNSSCFSTLYDICHTCSSGSDIVHAEFNGASIPDKCYTAALLPLIFISIGAFCFGAGAIFFGKELKQQYAEENAQAWRAMGLPVSQVFTYSQVMAMVCKTEKLLEIIDSSLHILPLDALEVLLEYLNDPGLNSIQRARSNHNTLSPQSFFYNNLITEASSENSYRRPLTP